MKKNQLLALTFSITFSIPCLLRAMETSLPTQETITKASIDRLTDRLQVVTKKLDKETVVVARESLQRHGLQGPAAAITKKTLTQVAQAVVSFEKSCDEYEYDEELIKGLDLLTTALEKCTDDEAGGLIILLSDEIETYQSNLSLSSPVTEQPLLSFTQGVDLEDDSQKECSIQ